MLIPANELSPNSYPSNSYYFRQDSTFRYLFGLDRPSLWGVIDLDSGEELLFGDDGTLEDVIWTGPQPLLKELAQLVGIEQSKQICLLQKQVSEAQSQGRKIHILPPYRGETKIALASLLGVEISKLQEILSPELIFSIAALRERKGAEEIEELERSYSIGYEMHTTAMRMAKVGVVEREIGGTLEGVARRMGGGVSFPPICTQHGETLHNIDREGVLESGRLMLCDAGGETLEGYCSDHTRTFPVNGRFTDVQRDVYNVALAAHDQITAFARPHLQYSELQRECYRVLAEGLRGLGFLRGSIEEIIERDAMRLFMPHGVSHGLGLDVHDCEAFGERSFDVEQFSALSAQSTACIIRSQWILEEGTVLTNEPGIYFIPELIERRRAEGAYSGVVDYDLVSKYLDFGGIRIEDDIVISDSGAYQIGAKAERQIPITVSEIESFMEEARR